jgi:peptide/nickel transport system permease protein
LPNALVPLVPYLTLEFATLAGGVLVIEQLFGIPGIGAYLMVSLDNHDSPAFLATVAVIAAAVAGAGLLGDGLVALIDPRIRQGKGDAT